MDRITVVTTLKKDVGYGLPGKPGMAYVNVDGNVIVGANRNLSQVGVSFYELSYLLPEGTILTALEDMNPQELMSLSKVHKDMQVDKKRVLFKTPEAFHFLIGRDALNWGELELLLYIDVIEATNTASNLFFRDEWAGFPEAVQHVIVQCLVSLGVKRFTCATELRSALRRRKWSDAADALLDLRVPDALGKDMPTSAWDRYHRYAETLRLI